MHSMYRTHSVYNMHSMNSMHNIHFPISKLLSTYQTINPLTNNSHKKSHFGQNNYILPMRSVLLYWWWEWWVETCSDLLWLLLPYLPVWCWACSFPFAQQAWGSWSQGNLRGRSLKGPRSTTTSDALTQAIHYDFWRTNTSNSLRLLTH